jgi:hypothetical protein
MPIAEHLVVVHAGVAPIAARGHSRRAERLRGAARRRRRLRSPTDRVVPPGPAHDLTGDPLVLEAFLGIGAT